MPMILTINYIKVKKKKPKQNHKPTNNKIQKNRLSCDLELLSQKPQYWASQLCTLLREAVLVNQFWQQQAAFNFA